MGDDIESAELPRPLLIDRHDLKHAFHKVLQAIDLHGQGSAPVSEAGTVEMLRLFSGADLASADIFALHAEHDERVRQMTKDQTRILGFLRNQRCVAVVGGAGSGKTWLALEQTRRLAKEGESVALVCYSRGLARFLRGVTAEWKPRERPSYVGLFHELPVKWGAPQGEEDDSAWLGEKLPALLGQLAPFPLDHNIRNTKRIAQVFGSLCLEQPSYDGLQGPPVRFIPCSSDEAVEAADDEVQVLTEEEGWPPGSVALLTTWHRHPEQVEIVERSGSDANWAGFFAGEDVSTDMCSFQGSGASGRRSRRQRVPRDVAS